MKKLWTLFVILLVAFMYCVAANAGSDGGTAPAVGKVNVSLTVPKESKAVCKTLAAGARSTVQFDVSGTTMVNWKAAKSDYDSTAVTVKRSFDANAAYMPGTTEWNLPIESGVTNLTFSQYSTSTNPGARICLDAN
jgi:hypothetical protein